jgi:outer membrane protein assembly factor BamD (BamD/ComL family)
VAPPRTGSASVDAEDEVAILGRAQRALVAGDAAAAIALAERHAQSFPTGLLVEEREAIAIEALTRLGRHELARSRFERFVAGFPRSGYRERLDRLVTGQR